MINKNKTESLFTSLAFYKNISKKYADKRLLLFQDDINNLTYLTGKMLVEKVMFISGELQKLLKPQDKVIILLPQGLDYISSVLSCFYTNITAIPTSVISTDVDSNIITEKILPIFKDAEVKYIITNASFEKLLQGCDGFKSASILCVNELDYNSSTVKFIPPTKPKLDDVALLLYTSGSTAKPKGVMLTHDNIVNQSVKGSEQWGIVEESCIVSWMPQFHNFGLFFNFMAPLLKGASSVILPPDSFVKNPYKWFEIINEYQATHTAAPNFAFDYCYSSLALNELSQISLKSLQAVICGGEPIRKETYENFIEKFKVLGFGKNIFCPHYGMSELGSVVTKRSGEQINFLLLDIPSLEKGIIKITKSTKVTKSVSSCGNIDEDVTILCVNPETGNLSKLDEVGEIWIKSSSVAKGYFEQNEATNEIFNRNIQDSEQTGFFRTGDLGFIKEQQLYIIGREKEVIIINGKNYHPVDLEWAIKKKIPDLTFPICVFSSELEQQEKIIVVQEIEKGSDVEYKNLSQKILNSVAEAYMLEIHEIYLINKGTIPKTGSGKIQRKNCKKLYQKGELETLYSYNTASVKIERMTTVESQDLEDKTLAKLKKEVLSEVLNIISDKLEGSMSFGELGLDSIKYINISKRIEHVFKINFAPPMLFKHQTIGDLAHYISTQIEKIDVSEIKQPELKEETLHNVNSEEDTSIAVIGMSCNFPGEATTPELFWDNLVNEKDCITEISKSRPQVIEDYKSLHGESADFAPKWGGFIKGVDQFDAEFFGISPLEAESMDPQQRKVLQLTWGVIEDGGYDPISLSGSDIGLFIGSHSNDYAELISKRSSLIDTYGAYTDSGLHMSMIPHRVSRWFDFHGPSEIINTACSSSLVAIHHAIDSINKGESTMAIAGGINLIFSSRIYLASYKAGMLSKDGHCKTFDDKADGFVRSEGFGAVLLKPYKEAIKDNDTIYGIIKGTAINHDGKSNSLRAPNVNAQKELIKSAYEEAGIPVNTIGYIETHGTGTSLGDPIEFQALKEAFCEIGANTENPFCGLGAVKSSIGHTESAAGIAGFIKTLLSIKAKTLPGISHFNKLNKFISLEKTPFYILDKTQEWKRLKGENNEELPRRAGISSFGFGGGNAHVIVEEHISLVNEGSDTQNKIQKVIVPFSAKNKERLLETAHNFIHYLEINSDKKLDLLDISYTLQVGRSGMEERIAFLVDGIQELKEKINLFIEGIPIIQDCWYGENTKNKNTAGQLGNNKDSQELINKWFKKNKLNEIAQSWAQGANIKWNSVYKKNKPRRINLPTYPFAKTGYWIPDIDPKKDRLFNGEVTSMLHPLLQHNTSDLTEQRFSTTFTGDEFFLSDHIIKGQRILPGVIYLEMVRAALENSYRNGGVSKGIKIKDITWNQPVIVDKEPVEVHIALYLEENEKIGFEVYTESKNENSISHSQGYIIVEPITPLVIDIDSLKIECNSIKVKAKQLYEGFSKQGINYGSSFKTVQEIYLGEGIALAKLNLPSNHESNLNKFLLHPSILDAALHASSALINNDEQNLALPYKIKELEIYSNFSSNMWVKIEHSNYDSKEEKINTFNITLCDDTGKVCAHITELTVLAVENSFGAKKDENMEKTLIFSPDWKVQPVSEKEENVPPEERLLLFIEPEISLVKETITELESEGIRTIVLNAEQEAIEERYTNYTLKLFKELQSIIKDASNKKVLRSVVTNI